MSKIKKNGGLDQYGPERFGRLILPQSENAGLKGLMLTDIKVDLINQAFQ